MVKNVGKIESWTKDKIIEQLQFIHKQNPEEFSSTFLKKNYSKLNNAIYRKFKNLQNALKASGIEYDVNVQNTWNYDSVKNYIEIECESGCKLLSNTFINNDEILEFKCRCGEVYYTSFNYFKSNKKQQCDQCGLGKSHDQFILEIEILFGGNITLLEKYKGGNTPINFKCSIHGDFTAKPSRVLDNILGCSKCGVEKAAESISKGERFCDVCGSSRYVQEFNKTGKNYCNKHYNQMRKYGHIKDKTIKDKNEIVIYDDYAEVILLNINLEEVGRALVSLDKINKIKEYKWYLMNNGYASSRSQGDSVLLHRLVTGVEHPMHIDHINRNRLDCRNENLRECTQGENARNSSLSKLNTSGVTGVWYSKRDNKWVAEIKINGKKITLGRSENKNEMIKIRQNAEIEYFKEFAPKRSEYNE